MLANAMVVNKSRRSGTEKSDIELSICKALGLETPEDYSLDGALQQGLAPIVYGLKTGEISEEQASLLVELLLASYVGAKINQQVEGTFRSWAEGAGTLQSGGHSERR